MVKPKMIRWAGLVARIGMRKAYNILIGNSEEKETTQKTWA
jgi:hypothetical protein